MSVFQRFFRYLILWGIMFIILCILSVSRYWDQFINIMSNTLDQYFSALLGVGLLVGILIVGYRLMFRALR